MKVKMGVKENGNEDRVENKGKWAEKNRKRWGRIMEVCSVMASILRGGGDRSPNSCCAAVCGSGWQSIHSGYPHWLPHGDSCNGPDWTLCRELWGKQIHPCGWRYFTKWMEVYALPDQEATTVAQKLVDKFFCRFSVPNQLHSDQGKQFESNLISSICKLSQLKKLPTTPYHTQCDGLVERLNRTLTNILASTAKEHPFEWESPRFVLHTTQVCLPPQVTRLSSSCLGDKHNCQLYLVIGTQPAADSHQITLAQPFSSETVS